MFCNRTYTPTHDQVTRSSSDYVFAGVCGGLGEHFGVSSNWLPAGFVIGTFWGVSPILYVVCIFLMPRNGMMSRAERRASRQERRAARKFKIPPIPSQAREQAYEDVKRQLDLIEGKIRIMEDHVTSKEYVLKRKFESL